MDAEGEGKLEAKSRESKNAAMVLRKGGFKVGGVDKAVNFSIAAVRDLLLQEGALGVLLEKGALVSSAVQIEPSAEIEILGGMELDIPLLDDSFNADAALYALVLFY